MSDDVTDGVDGDEPWILQGTSGRACAEEPSDAMDEGLETLEKEQKIKPRLCVCLEKQHLLRCMDEKVLRHSLRSKVPLVPMRRLRFGPLMEKSSKV
jgi:hypothetical protein